MLIQILNYAHILAERERIVDITRDGDAEHIRFYDFLDGGLVRFNLLTVRWADGEARHDLHETTLRPWLAEDVAAALVEAGFISIETFGGLGFRPYDVDSSPGVLLVARAPG